ncbi:hypothetical protein M1L60_35945 [Actinoplanes sp. TRM 88003]|uniref:Uncharacterized protein n=1 Tax=Paractinoplanes aksuensis TaxID=2939490 RepID=A0ABT1DZ01_9ACTN|nr:hypothetical protein [Actinoplanes aksuensis]MCO8275985.1 hypothetical protein [Actinoplanes aksuensis]
MVLFILLAILDVAGAVPAGDVAPPLGVIIAGVALGLITLAAAVPARRGNRRAAYVVVGSRALSALLGIGAFFDDRAPPGSTSASRWPSSSPQPPPPWCCPPCAPANPHRPSAHALTELRPDAPGLTGPPESIRVEGAHVRSVAALR